MVDVVVDGNQAATQIAVRIVNHHHRGVIEARNAVFWQVENGQVIAIQEFHDSAALHAARAG